MKVGWETLICSSPRHPSTSVTAVSLHLPTMQHWLWAFEMQLCSILAGMDEPSLSSAMLRKQLWSSKTYQPKVWPRTLLFTTDFLLSLQSRSTKAGVKSSLGCWVPADGQNEGWGGEAFPWSTWTQRESPVLLHSCYSSQQLYSPTASKAPEGLSALIQSLWGISTWFYFLLAAYFWLRQQIQS